MSYEYRTRSARGGWVVIDSSKPGLGRLEAMHKLFSPMVKGLRAAEYVAEDVPTDGTEGEPPCAQRVE